MSPRWTVITDRCLGGRRERDDGLRMVPPPIACRQRGMGTAVAGSTLPT